MTDDATAPDKNSSKRTKREVRSASRSLGRRIALAIYWAFALYMAGVGFWSIPRQIFFPPRGGMVFESCREGVTTLLEQLQASEVPRAGVAEAEAAARKAFLREWDAAYAGLDSTCAGHEAYDDLERLRYRVESALVRYERDQAPLVEEIERELERPSR